jgi:maltose alpha-D-glucosyltransferase/alpha-amylase
MSSARDSDLWWRNAMIYCLDVETFLDSNGDGVGDLQGLIRRIDYLAGMGISCIWLMPFYPSANRDDGYDITDFYSVDPRLGTLGDFVELVRAAKDRGLRVLVDLVVNHTSDRHPWFRSARSSRTSAYRAFYVWSDTPLEEPGNEVVFPDAEDSLWTWDDKAGQYYLHHFYSHQPDLNIANPDVRDEIARIAGLWLQLGVDGFRVDAVPFLLETGGIKDAPALDPHLGRAPARRRRAARRGEPPPGVAREVLRRRSRRRAPAAVQLPRDEGDVPRVGAPRCPAARDGTTGDAVAAGAVPVGELPAQPRRADPRPADRLRA